MAETEGVVNDEKRCTSGEDGAADGRGAETERHTCTGMEGTEGAVNDAAM